MPSSGEDSLDDETPQQLVQKQAPVIDQQQQHQQQQKKQQDRDEAIAADKQRSVWQRTVWQTCAVPACGQPTQHGGRACSLECTRVLQQQEQQQQAQGLPQSSGDVQDDKKTVDTAQVDPLSSILKQDSPVVFGGKERPVREYASALVQGATSIRPDWLSRISEDPLVIPYGSDCTGFDAPLHALSEVAEAVNVATGKTSIQTDYAFCSEDPTHKGDAGRRLVCNNFNPKHVLRGCEVDGEGFVHCMKENRLVRKPEVLAYTAGTVCKDRSRENNCRKPLEERKTSSSGRSTTTLHDSIDFIREKEPPIVCLEYLCDEQFLQLATALLKGIRDGIYIVCSWVFHSRTARMSVGRKRLYIWAFHSEKITILHPLAEWRGNMLELCECLPEHQLEHYLLPADSPDVEFGLDNLRSLKEMESKITARSASNKNGVRWSKDFETHQTFRAAVCDQIGIAIPDASELARSDLATGSCHLLPERALDALLLHKFVAHHVCGDWENLSGYLIFLFA